MENLFKFHLLADSNVPLIIWLAVVDFFLIATIVLVIVTRRHGKKNPNVVDNDWFDALGGKENVKEVTAVGSRLTLNLENKDNIDRDKLKTLGVSSVLVMSNKVTLVIEGQAEKVAEALKQSL